MDKNEKPTVIPWKSIEPISDAAVSRNGAFGALEALKAEWSRRLDDLPEADRVAIRQRTLRRLAVETGILERLYDLEWGLTLSLVAEGFTRDVIERSGGRVDDHTLATLRAQMDTLGLVLDFVRTERPLSTSFIKQLHAAITRTQDTYVVTDSLGRVTEAPLVKGGWKTQPNHVLREDNTLLEYSPPEHVASEVDRLVALWSELQVRANVHPIIKAAWLHHRFVQIHPFADGNGRVARALVLLVMELYRHAPLVVDRWHRAEYLRALDAANAGDLSELIGLFVKLEGAALTSELERPEEQEASGVSSDVAHTLATQLVQFRKRRESGIMKKLDPRARAVAGRMSTWFREKRDELERVLRERDVEDVRMIVDSEMPPTSQKTHWFHGQIIESARRAGHYADFKFFVGWCSLRVRVEGLQLRFVASLHGAGRDVGVMAVTTFAEIEPRGATDKSEDEEAQSSREQIATTTDAFRFVYTEDTEKRAQELEQLLDEGLANALVDLMRRF